MTSRYLEKVVFNYLELYVLHGLEDACYHDADPPWATPRIPPQEAVEMLGHPFPPLASRGVPDLDKLPSMNRDCSSRSLKGPLFPQADSACRRFLEVGAALRDEDDLAARSHAKTASTISA
jgi:hypothetical protein